jgi:pimeloyl-ACP methyl ester carboxylesterase
LAGTAPNGETWFTAAWLTVPGALRRPELQILLHGAGYDHRYWDWPFRPESYSYVKWAAEHGIATLNIDRIGSGSSSRPAGASNTVAAQAEVLDHVVADIRHGGSVLGAFDRIVLVGHSLGSVVAGYTATVRDDVDAVVLTGYLPVDHGNQVEDQFLDEAFVPAVDALPHLRGLVDEDYLAARPETREQLMFRAGQVDPAILEVDYQIRGATSRGELGGAWSAGSRILQATAPTLALVGQYDVLVLDPRTDADAFDAVRRLRAGCPKNFEFEVMPETGHNLNLHFNAFDTYQSLNRWLELQANGG